MTRGQLRVVAALVALFGLAACTAILGDFELKESSSAGPGGLAGAAGQGGEGKGGGGAGIGGGGASGEGGSGGQGGEESGEGGGPSQCDEKGDCGDCYVCTNMSGECTGCDTACAMEMNACVQACKGGNGPCDGQPCLECCGKQQGPNAAALAACLCARCPTSCDWECSE